MQPFRSLFRGFPPWIPAIGLLFLLLAAIGYALGKPRSVPVLMYHHIAPDPGTDIWDVSTDDFRHQIAGLKAAGYHSILPADLEPSRRWRLLFHRKPILITFDDGLLSVMTEAEPILREAGFHAISYLILGFIADTPAQRQRYRNDDCLTWEEVRAMQARGTIAFGIHSFSHAPDPARQALEVRECREIFKRKTGVKPTDYCYPYGGASDPLRAAVAAAGYRTAMVCSDRLFTLAPRADLLRIPRISVYGGRHDIHASPPSPSADGFCAVVRNDGVPLPVAACLRDTLTGRSWPLASPVPRLGPQPQTWSWTHLPPGLSPEHLKVEIWEQNQLFQYH